MFREVILQTSSDSYIYREEDKIGEGGFGSVYLGKGMRDGLPVAIKRPHFYSDDALKRFKEKDCRYLPQLRHPYIVSVLAVLTEVRNAQGEVGPPALIMEYIAGKNLEVSWTESVRFLSNHQKLELFKKICAGVAYAHRKEIIHRDLKPGNILLDAQKNPRIIDFGLAASLKPEELRSISTTNQFMGSLLYMAPEQYDAKAADARADIYSLGLILFFIFTGWHAKALLLKGEDTLAQMADKYLPLEVATLMKGACESDRARRVHSLQEFLDLLEMLLAQLSGKTPSLPIKNMRLPVLLPFWGYTLLRHGTALSIGSMAGLVGEQIFNTTIFWPWLVTGCIAMALGMWLVPIVRGIRSGLSLMIGKGFGVVTIILLISAWVSGTMVWGYWAIGLCMASIVFWLWKLYRSCL